MNPRSRPTSSVHLHSLLAVLCATLAAACTEPKRGLTASGMIPAEGTMAGGTAVTITGANFPTTIDSVLVGTGRLGSLVRVSATQLTGITPASSATGTVDLTVYTTSVGSATCTGCFTYKLPVSVIDMSPPGGPTAGGTAVTVGGVYPVAIDSVRIGAGRLVSLQQVDSWHVTGTTPAASSAGKVDVTVYTATWGSGTCVGCFRYAVFTRYAVTFLGAGVDSSRAVDINDSGVVVGTAWSAATGWSGRLWPKAGAAIDLGTLLPVALNNRGSVVGFDTAAALWENGAARALGGLGALNARYVYPTDINDQGQVALLASGHAYLWRNDSVTPLQAQWYLSALGRMNESGEVAASGEMGPYWIAMVLSAGTARAFGGGGRWSQAVALNDAGVVVGTAEYQAGGPSGGYLYGFGPLPFSPAAINDSLQVVGQGSIWQDSVTASLAELLVDSSWRVSNAVAINERGQIAAYGVNTATGARGAIRLDPVAPASSPARARRR